MASVIEVGVYVKLGEELEKRHANVKNLEEELRELIEVLKKEQTELKHTFTMLRTLEEAHPNIRVSSSRVLLSFSFTHLLTPFSLKEFAVKLQFVDRVQRNALHELDLTCADAIDAFAFELSEGVEGACGPWYRTLLESAKKKLKALKAFTAFNNYEDLPSVLSLFQHTDAAALKGQGRSRDYRSQLQLQLTICEETGLAARHVTNILARRDRRVANYHRYNRMFNIAVGELLSKCSQTLCDLMLDVDLERQELEQLSQADVNRIRKAALRSIPSPPLPLLPSLGNIL